MYTFKGGCWREVAWFSSVPKLWKKHANHSILWRI